MDVMIPLEALLSDGNQGTTYKIGINMSGLYKLLNSSDSVTVLQEMKAISGVGDTPLCLPQRQIGVRRTLPLILTVFIPRCGNPHGAFTDLEK